MEWTDRDERALSIGRKILDERDRQDEQWGGPKHDDTHDEYEWLSYMGHQADKISEILWANGFYGFQSQQDTTRKPVAYPLTRQHFVKIAALAVAAIESLDRKSAK